MKIAFFDTHRFDKAAFLEANQRFGHEIVFFETRLTPETANLAQGFPAVCAFVNDNLGAKVLQTLAAGGTRVIALRSAGFNHVDLNEASALGMRVARVPEYSPYAVAEHAVALILSLNRKIHKAYQRVREGNFSLDGLVGFDLRGKTVGVIGTGKIGAAFVQIMKGFGCEVLAYDRVQNAEVSKQANYVSLEDLLHRSDIVSLHVPLTPETRHLLNEARFAQMKKGVMLINTGRGALIETKALIRSLKSGHLGAAGLDVYEEEEGIFFENLSEEILQDDHLARLLTFPNVLLTSHQAFLTHEALKNIADTTLQNVADLASGKKPTGEVIAEKHVAP